MRTRSNTIYADSAEDYVQESESKGSSLSERRSRFSRKVAALGLEDDCLGSTSEFKLEVQEPTSLKDMEKKEEENIMNAISDLNEKYAEMKASESPRSALLRDRQGTFTEIVLHSMNPSSVSTITSLEKDDPNCFSEIISRNVKDYTHKIKILVLGSERVGKTTLVNQALGSDIERPSRTKALRIKKVTKEIDGKRVKIEFLDTNVKIQNSKMLESYLKIADGVLFLIDPAREETVNFVVKLAERAIQHNNEFFIVGNIFNNLAVEDEIVTFKKSLVASNQKLEMLSSKLVTTVNFVNLHDESHEKLLNCFYSRLLMKK